MSLNERTVRMRGKASLMLRSKRGSSLGMVMAIGAALVIWVMAIMPLMTTSGTVALNTAETEQDYLDSRSAIEFAKSELNNIVKTRVPYTFAVTEAEDSGVEVYEAVAKRNLAGGIDPDYSGFVKDDITKDDTFDIPQDTAQGKKVAAICAVELSTTDASKYNITITTYNDGEKGISYAATYTVAGSLLVYPESYRQTQALPLSDFVLVDGKLGANEVWKSNIHTLGYKNYINTTGAASAFSSYKDGFAEELLPWMIKPTANHANAGEYPAVFKVVAHASTSANTMTPVPNESVEAEKWILPVAGDFYFDGETCKASTTAEGQLKDIILQEDMYKLYFNGNETIPTAPGSYAVTLDYYGTGTYVKNGLNFLPISGVRIGTYNVTKEPVEYDVTSCKIQNIEQEGDNSYNVTLTAFNKWTMYGYSVNADGSDIQWQQGNSVINITTTETAQAYYFYCYQPGFLDANNVVIYKDAAKVVYVGVVAPFKQAEELEESKDEEIHRYIMVSDLTEDPNAQEKVYYELENAKTGLTSREVLQVGNLGTGLFVHTEEEILEWELEGIQKTDTSLKGKIKQGEKYLTLTATDHWDRYMVFFVPVYEFNHADYFAQMSNSGEAYDLFNNGVSKSFTFSKGGKTVTRTGYLNIDKAGCSASETLSDTYFIPLPAQGQVPEEVPVVPYSAGQGVGLEGTGTVSVEDVKNQISNALSVSVTNIYTNMVLANDAIGVGRYELYGDIVVTRAVEAEGSVDGEVESVFETVSYGGVWLGSLEVDKTQATVTAGLNFGIDTSVNENQVNISCVSWTTESSGTLKYIGYKEKNEPANNPYHWIPYNGGDQSMILPYGEYKIAVMQGGDGTYAASTPVEVVFAEGQEYLIVEAPPVTITEDQAQFLYTLEDKGGYIGALWVKLPETSPDSGVYKVLPKRISMRYGIQEDSNPIQWSSVYTPAVNCYGIVIRNATYALVDMSAVHEYNGETIYELSGPLPLTANNGHCNSVLTASSMYFMGDSGSIDTHENAVSLTTDLLVLKKDILNTKSTGEQGERGPVYVYPYTKDNGDILMFCLEAIVRDGVTIFEEKQFYQVPSAKDINNVTAAEAATWRCDSTSISRNASGSIVDITFPESIHYFFRVKRYPKINLDIAYATAEQLAHIVSGEAIKWVNNGAFGGNNEESNLSYVVCAYIETMSGDVEYKANRVLIAAADKGSGNNLLVKNNIVLHTRYLSVDADVIQQQGSTAFVLKNLSLVPRFAELIGLSENYTSSTMQMDYERYTSIVNASGAVGHMTAQICRYADGTNLFEEYDNKQPLMVTYKNDEINSLFDSHVTARGVERYISIVKGNSGTIDLGGLFASRTLKLYTNYLYFGPGVNRIYARSINPFDSGEILLNSQESGYTEYEYLGLFRRHSAEKYSGTLVYFANNVTVEVGWWSTKTIASGFYLVPATTNGTNLLKLAESPATYRIDQTTLGDYAIYIDPITGNISDAYVDTGIFDGEGSLGGFSGGAVQ